MPQKIESASQRGGKATFSTESAKQRHRRNRQQHFNIAQPAIIP
jgi:hypothetical protein